MDLGRAAAERGWSERSVFVCDYQTRGRGRQGRPWEAGPGLGLLFTVLLRNDQPPFASTMLAVVALCEAIERLAGVEAGIKWPNDLLFEGAKLAGVLTESYSGPAGGYALVGCGLNVNQTADDLADLGRTATSVSLAAGRPVHRGELLVLCLERMETRLGLEPAQRLPALRQAWEARLWGRGQQLLVRDQGVEFVARLEGVDQDGALLVRPADGGLRRVVSGEIVL